MAPRNSDSLKLVFSFWQTCLHTSAFHIVVLNHHFAEGSDSSSNTKTTSNYSENQTRAKVAKYVSLHGKKISHATLATAIVYDVAQQEPATFGQIWTDLNSKKISPNKAYKNMQRIQTRQNEIVEPQPSTTKGTDYDDNGKEVIAKSSRRDVTECEHCQIKDFRIKELEDAVRKTTQLTPANQISEGKDDKIKQLHKELDLEIQEIQGIGPTTSRKLKEAGMVTVMDLAVSRASELAVHINASKESTGALIVATQKLIRDSHIIEKELKIIVNVLLFFFIISTDRKDPIKYISLEGCMSVYTT